MLSRVVPSLALVALMLAAPASAQAPAAKLAGPVVVVETSKGVFEFETYPADAPKTVARILELALSHVHEGGT